MVKRNNQQTHEEKGLEIIINFEKKKEKQTRNCEKTTGLTQPKQTNRVTLY